MNPLDNACPVCHVPAGQGCRNKKSGKPLVGSHAERSKAATSAHGVERVLQFRALDGTMHATYAAARKHNTERELETWLDAWLDREVGTNVLTTADIKLLAAALRADWHVSKKHPTEKE